MNYPSDVALLATCSLILGNFSVLSFLVFEKEKLESFWEDGVEMWAFILGGT